MRRRYWRYACAAGAALLLAACSGNYEGGDEILPGPAGSPGDLAGADLAAGRANYEQQCANCHGASGGGTQSGPSLIGCASCAQAAALVDRIATTMPLGNVTACGVGCATDTAAYILTTFNGQALDATLAIYDDVERLDADLTLRKAALNLAGRLPTAQELQVVAAQGDGGVQFVLDSMMREPAFHERIVEIYNDVLLQNKYLGGERALSLLRDSDFPQRRWFDQLGLDTENDEQERALFNYLRAQTNDAVAQEALRQIAYVVANDLPIGHMLTGDYIVANYFSARAYGADSQHVWRSVEDAPFPEYPQDPTDFRPVRIANVMYGAIPHAGILTSAMFLNRFPTSNNNRNRHRSRMVYRLFVDTDILQLGGVRPGDADAVDITSPTPTIDNPDCVICHSVLDPVASIFQNWNENGQYEPSRLNGGWYSDMEARGFNGETMPLGGNVDSSVRWLAQQIVGDPRFAASMVKTLFTGLTGQEPLPSPPVGTPSGDPRRIAFEAQTAYFSSLESVLVGAGMNVKPVISAIVLGPYFRARALVFGADENVHAETGSARLLTPEMLHRRIAAVAGQPWQRFGRDRLVGSAGDSLRILYGGIDSDVVTQRITSPNGVIAAAQLRMANQMACAGVARDFYRPAFQRVLFPYVEPGDSLLDDGGNVDAAARVRIERNLQYLGWRLWGEDFPTGDAELQTMINLIESVQRTGRAAAAGSTHFLRNRLHFDCDLTQDPDTGTELPPEQRIVDDPSYMLRAWQAVLAYMFSDYEFVYE